MRRVVVTGMGIVSSIGNNTQEVLASLREAKSGITFSEDQAKLGFRSQVAGAPTLDAAAIVDLCQTGRRVPWANLFARARIRKPCGMSTHAQKRACNIIPYDARWTCD